MKKDRLTFTFQPTEPRWFQKILIWRKWQDNMNFYQMENGKGGVVVMMQWDQELCDILQPRYYRWVSLHRVSWEFKRRVFSPLAVSPPAPSFAEKFDFYPTQVIVD